MPLVSSFGELIALDMKRDKLKIENKQDLLQMKALEIQDAIKDTIEEGHQNFKEKIAKRQARLDKVFKDNLPALKPDEQKKIKTTCEQIMKRANAEEGDDLSDFI